MTPHHKELRQDVRSFYHFDKTSQAYGTFWKYAGGWVSAYHVYKEQKYSIPIFANGPVQVGYPTFDAVFYGCDLNSVSRPRLPKEGERIYLYGAPQTTGIVNSRFATVYLKRSNVANVQGELFTAPTWIGKIDQLPSVITGEGAAHIPYAQVSVGMSGGLVVSEAGEPLGILVMQTSPMDSNHDGVNEQYFDFVALQEVYDFLKDSPTNTV